MNKAMDDPRELEYLRNYNPSIDDLKMKPVEFKSDNFGKKRLGKSYSQTVDEILNKPFNGHPSREEDYQQREAIRFLAKQIDQLYQIMFAYKEGKL